MFSSKEKIRFWFGATGSQSLGGTQQGGDASPPLHFNVQTKQGPTVSVSNIENIACVKKLHGPEISPFLPFMLQFLPNLQRLFTFSNYIGEIGHFEFNLIKKSNT